MKTLSIDLAAHDLYRAGFPYAVFAELRRESPVWWHPTTPTRRTPSGVDFWVVLGQPELQEASRDWSRFSSIEGSSLTKTPGERSGHTLVASDPPAHTRLRKLVNAGFTPRMIAKLDDLVEQRTTEVLDAAAERNDCDLVQDIALQLPLHIIADIVGIPEADRVEVFRMIDLVTRVADPAQGYAAADGLAAERWVFDYAERLGEEKRRRPADDVWSILAVAEIEDDDGNRTRLSPLELDMFFLILAIAGSETTRNVTSGGLLALLDHPDQMDAVRRDPARLPAAVEEMIRWVSPVVCFARTATVDLELGGQPIRAGDRVTLWFPAANRDERVFTDPDRFDTTRTPNPHVAFGGGGMHFCLGSHLARRELRVMFGQLLTRFPDVAVTGPVSYLVGAPEQTVAVSLDRVPVRLAP
ncbi:MAG: cytochrome P450 [Acidimicrobiia bacterium]|jgi:cytochrome P450